MLSAILRFTFPTFLALLLKALYGGVDLWVVGQYAETADVSGVSVDSMVMHTATVFITGLTMGITVLVSRRIGEQAGHAIGSGIFLFSILAIIITAGMVYASAQIARLVNAPQEAFRESVLYILICSALSRWELRVHATSAGICFW